MTEILLQVGPINIESRSTILPILTALWTIPLVMFSATLPSDVDYFVISESSGGRYGRASRLTDRLEKSVTQFASIRSSGYPPGWRQTHLLTIARIMLYCAAALIVLGGLYDVFVPRLPSNLVAMCGGNERACKLVRELLRALGGSLVAVGATVALLVCRMGVQDRPRTLMLVLLLVLPSEGINSLGMYRVGSPFLVPLAFTLLTLLGVLLAWPGLFY